MPSSILYRPVLNSEQTQALELWKMVFEPKGDGYFERYFSSTASPHYREGDTLGAWSDENLLVSIVHIRRMILRSTNNLTYLCGVVSNVGTRVEFRNQGLSRHLLGLAIDKMENDSFDFSMLGTGRSNHYLPLGWKPLIQQIQYVIDIPNDPPSFSDEQLWTSASSITSYDQLLELYSSEPRPYQFDRCPASMFDHWIGWHWRDESTSICMLPNKRGYAVISQPDGKGSVMCVSEWHALDAAAETVLLHSAAEEIRRRCRQNTFFLHTLPQYTTLEGLGWRKDRSVFEVNEDIMIRNIRLLNETFQSMKVAFTAENGKATFWPGEYF